MHPNLFRSFSLLCAAMLCAGPVSAESEAERTLTYNGAAIDLETGVFRYREHHWLRYQGPRLVERRVRYLCADGQPFAEKRVDYTASRFAPEFELSDARSGYREGLRGAGASAEVFVQSKRGATAETAALARTPTVVADAGFDEYLLEKWEGLAAGESLRFDFLVPSERKAIGFKVRDVSEPGSPFIVARLSLGSWLAFLAPSLDAHYDRQTRRLVRYEGLSNLRDGEGKNYLVRIDFPEAPVLVAADIAAKSHAVPLVQACMPEMRAGAL
ncbi:MAG: hypothetical protein IPK97_06665 [Ahniella sp.]|nr:hypothetical protein [Ahniella sp.]